jgi:hypothetical protein
LLVCCCYFYKHCKAAAQPKRTPSSVFFFLHYAFRVAIAVQRRTQQQIHSSSLSWPAQPHYPSLLAQLPTCQDQVVKQVTPGRLQQPNNCSHSVGSHSLGKDVSTDTADGMTKAISSQEVGGATALAAAAVKDQHNVAHVDSAGGSIPFLNSQSKPAPFAVMH